MIAYVPIIAVIIGILLYVLPTNAKVQEIGRALFWSGLFVTLWSLAGHTVRLMPS